MRALQKLLNTPMRSQVAYQLKKIADELQKARTTIGQEYEKEIVNVYAVRGEKGDIVRPEDDPMGFDVDPSKRDEFKRVQDDFGKRIIRLERHKITLHDLDGVALSAAELSLLEPIYAEPQEAEAPKLGVVSPLSAVAKSD